MHTSNSQQEHTPNTSASDCSSPSTHSQTSCAPSATSSPTTKPLSFAQLVKSSLPKDTPTPVVKTPSEPAAAAAADASWTRQENLTKQLGDLSVTPRRKYEYTTPPPSRGRRGGRGRGWRGGWRGHGMVSPVSPQAVVVPFVPVVDAQTVKFYVLCQVEYYFSVENLCRDIFFRKQMDAEGYVPLSVIAGFNRVRSLTNDLQLIREALAPSAAVELAEGDKIRKRDDWHMWVLPEDQRVSATEVVQGEVAVAVSGDLSVADHENNHA